MRRIATAAFAATLVWAGLAQAQPKVEVKQRGEEPVLQVLIDGKLFTEYHYGVDKKVPLDAAKTMQPEMSEDDIKALDWDKDGVLSSADQQAINAEQRKGEEDKSLAGDAKKRLESARKALAGFIDHKPYLWPVLGEGDVTVTRNWPMGEAEGPTDHEHQKSFWTAHGSVNGADLWTETYSNSGFQMVDEVTSGSGDEYGWIRSKQTWQDKEHKPVVAEEREYRFYPTPASGRLFDLTVTFTAAHGDAVFGDTKEGGIAALRIRPEIQEKNGSGLVTTADAENSKTLWGKPSEWCDYSGKIEGAGVRGVTIMDHPSNLRHPVRWHVRDYGLMGANYFGIHDFEPSSAEKGEWTLKSGESQTFKYRVYVHSGDVKEAKVAEAYKTYIEQVPAK